MSDFHPHKWDATVLRRKETIDFLINNNKRGIWPDSVPDWDWMKLKSYSNPKDQVIWMIARFNYITKMTSIEYENELIDVTIDKEHLIELRNEYLQSKVKRRFTSLLLNDGVEFKTIGKSLLSGGFTLLHLESGQYFPFEVPGKHLIIKWKHKYE